MIGTPQCTLRQPWVSVPGYTGSVNSLFDTKESRWEPYNKLDGVGPVDNSTFDVPSFSSSGGSFCVGCADTGAEMSALSRSGRDYLEFF